ncbi:peptide-methionine (R)-S-oxide reductase [Candidatus Peregrinibacteria bacterium CG11_big_fil_rev_8_21_14_0_20_41_10]|nr:MAG: peptide-methionine (R)-S-oxide reductase [Candidatus Peregrinibacteria bacterium CG11_big_fil_rev_8_21_14_0_20_41_10]
MTDDMKNMLEAYWREKLTPEQYKVMRQAGTEAPFTGELYGNKKEGMYKCAACGSELFASGTKFESGTGWPSFDNPVNLEHVKLHVDDSLGMRRTEVRCAACDAHLGHVFDDGPSKTTGKRYCINSCALNFEEGAK